MAIVLSPSTMWGVLTCPYKFYNSVYVAEPTNVIHGYLMNAAWCAWMAGTDNKLWPRLRYYNNYVNAKLEKKKQLSLEALKTWMWKIYKLIRNYVTPDYQIFQEQKFDYPWEFDSDGEDIWISGQPDIIVLYNNPDRETGIVCEVIDIKCGKISWYEKPDIWRENAQRYVYPWFIFNHFWQEITLTGISKPIVKFSFAVVDKSSWDLQLFSKELDEYTVNIQMKEHIKQLRELQKQNLDKKDYPATKCRWCAFCEFADTCPLKAQEVQVTDEEINQLF